MKRSRQLSASPATDDDRDGRGSSSVLVRLDDAYLPVRMLSEYSGLSVRTLRGYLTHPVHALPCYRIGGKVLVRRSEFDEWARQFRAAPTSAVDALVTDALRGL